MDRFDYGDEGKWPIAPDGSGATLAMADSNTPSDDPSFWTSSVFWWAARRAAGNFPRDPTPQRRALVSLDQLWRFEASGTDLGTAWPRAQFRRQCLGRAKQRHPSQLLAIQWQWPLPLADPPDSLVNGVTPTTDRNGVANGALAFTGTSSQYVSVPGGGGLNAAIQGTISLWVRWTGTQDGDCCGTFGAVLARQANGQFSDDILALNAADPASGRIVWRQSGGPAPVVDHWHRSSGKHLAPCRAVTFAPGGSTLLCRWRAARLRGGTGLGNNPATILSIGAWAGDGGGFSTSSMDDVAIWDRPLTAGPDRQPRQPTQNLPSILLSPKTGRCTTPETDGWSAMMSCAGPCCPSGRRRIISGANSSSPATRPSLI
jgi:hypothetical protein